VHCKGVGSASATVVLPASMCAATPMLRVIAAFGAALPKDAACGGRRRRRGRRRRGRRQHTRVT
jgi:hypothetical protein